MNSLARSMTPKQLILTMLTVVVVVFFGLNLLASWSQPQIQSQLELRETNLLLQVTALKEWQRSSQTELTMADEIVTGSRERETVGSTRGEELFELALKKYQEALQSNQDSLDKTMAQLQAQQNVDASTSQLDSPWGSSATEGEREAQLQAAIAKSQTWNHEIRLRLGLLQMYNGETKTALQTWTALIDGAQGPVDAAVQANAVQANGEIAAAKVLVGFWSDPPRLLPEAEQQIQQSLAGWFRYQSLKQLYRLQQRQDALEQLQIEEQTTAQQTFRKLAVLRGFPIIISIVGVSLGLVLIGQRVFRGQKALLAQNGNRRWSVPWEGEIVWQVLIVGFFGMSLFLGQILIPLVFGLLRLDPGAGHVKLQAFYTLANYLCIAAAGIGVLYGSLKPFLPLPADMEWFQADWRQRSWIGWGLGGFLVALPIVIAVSLVNQLFWQGQGGNNPVLSMALDSQDALALAILVITATIAAPLFEEILFRGFLLPSLTRYVPVWGAIAISSLLFACAHLNLSEVLPLATLGMILGVVYTRSRNLLAPILLHSLWNSNAMLNLVILGSSPN